MAKHLPLAFPRPIPGTGQSKTLTSGADAAMTNAISKGFMVQLSCTTFPCLVTISQAGTAATSSGDVLLKTSDPPLVLACQPGDKIHAWGLGGASILYAVEMTY
jgi:hypothetical protein